MKTLKNYIVSLALTAAVLTPLEAQAQYGGFVGGLAGGIIGGAIAGSIANSAQQRPVYVIQQRRVVVRRAAPRTSVARVKSGGGKTAINTAADPFATGKSTGSEPIPVSAKQ